MNVALRRGMTLEEFLCWEESQEERWEFDGFAPVAMVGGTRAHALITVKLLSVLRGLLEGGSCTVYNDSLKIIAAGSTRYPDAFVACGPFPAAATVAANPVVVFEVESPGTAQFDYGVKNAEYRGTPSILRYVIVAQDRVLATVFARVGDAWVGSLITDAAAVLEMPEIGVSLPLAALYEGLFEES